MDKLSSIIQEAKPLYKKRKRNKLILCVILTLCTPSIFLTVPVRLCLEGNSVYVALNNNTLQNELIKDDYGLRLGH